MYRSLSAAPAALAVLCLALGFSGCHGGKGSSGASSSTSAYARVALAQHGNIAQVLTLAGQFQPYQVVDVHPKVSGYMKRINVDIGDIVHQGETLAILEVPELSAELEESAFQLKQSQQEITRAQQEINRAKALNFALHAESVRLETAAATRPGLIAQQELDDAKAKDLDSQAQIDAARAAMAAAEQHAEAARANNERLQALEGYTNVTAPLAGVVIWRYADTGALIQGGTNSNESTLPIVRLSQSSLLRLRFPVPEDDVKYVHIGDTIRVRVDAIHRAFEGKVVRFTRNVDFDTRTMETEVDVENKDLSIAPGMYANAALPLASESNVVTVPVESLVLHGQQQTVFVLDTDNRIQVRNVTVGLQGQKLAGVTSGLVPGDRVLDGGQEKYREGETVNPLVVSTPASETMQVTGGTIDMKAEQAVTNAAMAPN